MTASEQEAPRRPLRKPPGPTPAATTHSRMHQERRNIFALLALFCGITAWVPWVVVLAAPLAWIFAIAAHVTALRRDQRRGLQLAWAGAVLAALGVALHLAIVFVFALAGHVFGLFMD